MVGKSQIARAGPRTSASEAGVLVAGRDGGTAPMEMLDACRGAMDVIGKRFENGEAFLPGLMLAGEMMTAILAMVKPRLAEESTVEKLSKVVFGTVEGDIHDIGL